MTDSSNVVGNSLLFEQRQVPLAGTAWLDLVAGTASFVTGNMEEDRGIMVLEAKLPDSQRKLEFRVGFEGMQCLGQILRDADRSEPPPHGMLLRTRNPPLTREQVVMDPNAGEPAPGRRLSKWQSFELCVNQVLLWQDLVDVADALREFGTRTKGTIEDQKVVLDGLRLGFHEQVSKIASLLETRTDGLPFLRHLLGSKHESMVRLGVFLMPSLLQSAVQDDLLQLVRERRLSRGLHAVCLAMLSPETRTEHLRSRRSPNDPAADASGAWRAQELAEANEPVRETDRFDQEGEPDE